MRRRQEHGPNHDLAVLAVAVLTVTVIWVAWIITAPETSPETSPKSPAPNTPTLLDAAGRHADAFRAARGGTRPSTPSPGRVPTEPHGRRAMSGEGQNSPAVGPTWRRLAACESSGDAHAVNPAGYYGLYQFDLATWASVGGTGNPVDASPAEQLMRAKRLHADRGWQPWPQCAAQLGLIP